MVGEDLRVQALGQRSDLAQRSIPYEVEREGAAARSAGLGVRPPGPSPSPAYHKTTVVEPTARFDLVGDRADRRSQPWVPSLGPLDGDWLAATIVIG